MQQFFGQAGEKINGLMINVNERFEGQIKERLADAFGRGFGTEAVLNKFDDFVDYLNRICGPPVKRYMGVHRFDKQLFRDVYKF